MSFIFIIVQNDMKFLLQVHSRVIIVELDEIVEIKRDRKKREKKENSSQLTKHKTHKIKRKLSKSKTICLTTNVVRTSTNIT